MLKILIISPIIGIISISLTTIINKIKLENNIQDKYINSLQNSIFTKFKSPLNSATPSLINIREIGGISTIITYYISLYILLKYNNNNIEYQLREKININWYEFNIGVDGISIILIILTTFIFPILFLLIPIENPSKIQRILEEEK